MGKTSKKYARALFESYEPKLLKEKSLALKDLALALCANEENLSFFNNPSIALESKEKTALEAVALLDQGDSLLSNFMRLLIANSVVSELSAIAQAFEQMLAEWEKSLALTVTFASQPQEHEKNELLARLQNEFGAGVSVDWQVNPGLIGGFTVKTGDKLLDSSVASSLEKIRKSLIA